MPAHKTQKALANEDKLNLFNILLVEDTASDALLTRISLDSTEIPYKLTTMRNGNDVIPYLQSGCDFAKNDYPDLILLDLGLPGIDGFEILAQLQNVPASMRAIPIIVMTAFDNFEYIQKIYPTSVYGYINKPCRPEDLNEILNKIVRH